MNLGRLNVLTLALVIAMLNAVCLRAENTRIYLSLDENKQVSVEPYHVYDIYVPLSSMHASESYWIRTYFSGAVSFRLRND